MVTVAILSSSFLQEKRDKKLGDSHQLKKEIKSLFLLSLGGDLPMLKMVFSA